MRIKYMRISEKDGLDQKPINYFMHKYFNLTLRVLTVIALAALYLGGIFTFLLEEDFSDYNHAMEIDNFRRFIDAIDRNGLLPMLNNSSDARRFGKSAINEVLSKMRHSNANLENIVPLNQFEGYEYTLDVEPSCRKQWGEHRFMGNYESSPRTEIDSPVTIIIIVKSAVNNYALRQAIRETWYLNRTLDDLIAFKTVFIVGKCDEKNPVPSSALALSPNGLWSCELCKKAIHNESSLFRDIIQSSDIDTYYNNTIKTFMSLRWVVERCPSDFTISIDDDFVFEVDNFASHLMRLASWESTSFETESKPSSDSSIRGQEPQLITSSQQFIDDKKPVFDVKLKTLKSFRALSSQYLYTGYMRKYVHPLRMMFSKWYISCHDYAYNRYPPFISGGAVLMSFKTIKHFYLASYFARTFRLDDVYVGMLAYKLGFLPEHNKYFMCSIETYLAANPIHANSTKCIGVHSIEPDRLLELWRQRNGIW